MHFGHVESAAGLEASGNYFGPASEVGKPAEDAVGSENNVELAPNYRRDIADFGDLEASGHTEVLRKHPRGFDCCRREVDTGYFGAFEREAQAVEAEVALEVEKGLAADGEELSALGRMQPR